VKPRAYLFDSLTEYFFRLSFDRVVVVEDFHERLQCLLGELAAETVNEVEETELLGAGVVDETL
jgi:hypothetical protein